MGKKFIKKNYIWLIVVLLIFVTSASVWNAWEDSAIFDETAHIGAAYSYVEKQDMRLNPEHPPLLKDLAGLPLLFLDLNFDTNQDFWQKDVNGQWDAGRSLLYYQENNADKILFFSRLPIILIFILFGLFIFKWGREMMGVYGGFLAFLLFIFDPNVLGHNHYVTTDLAIAAFLTFAFYYFLRFIKKPTTKNIWLLGIFLALFQLAKFSAVVAFPVFAIILLLYPLVIKKTDKSISQFGFRLKKLWEYLWKFSLSFLISLVLVLLIYGLNMLKMPQEKVSETINYYFSSELNAEQDNQAEIYTSKTLNFLSQQPIVGKPLSYYGLGIAMVFKRVSGGNSVYYLGQVSNQAFVSYFPVVFLIKETFFHLTFYAAALVIVLITFLKFIGKSFRRKLKDTLRLVVYYLRNHIDSVTLALFILLYSYISITGNLNLGIRHLFPILPPIYLLTTKVLTGFLKRSLDKTKDLIIELFLLLAMVLIFLETALAFPFYLSYFNPLGGGVYGGYRMVTDSNADWGQDLKRLKDFVDSRPYIEKIRVDYFGGGDIEYYLGDRVESWWDSRRPIEAGWYAVSANYLQSSNFDETKFEQENYSWLRGINPVAKAGTSIFIYFISTEQAEELNVGL